MSANRDAAKVRKGRRRYNRKLYRPWYWLAMLTPTLVARKLPSGVRTFVDRWAARGI